MKYRQLNQKNPEYNCDEIRKLQLLYCGGHELTEHAHELIPQELARGESSLTYHDRLKCVSYRPYLSKLINDFVSDLFSKSFSVLPAPDSSDENTTGDDLDNLGGEFYKEFAEDCDLQNHNLSFILSKVLTCGLIAGRAYLGVDFPVTAEIPLSIADEEELNSTRAYVYEIPTLSVIDWNYDNFGKLTYIVLKDESIPRETFSDSRDRKVISFKVWEKNNGKVTWKLFQIIIKLNKEPKPEDDVVLIDEGEVSFKDIPVLCLNVPAHLYIGGLVGEMCLEEFRRRSSLVFAINRNLFSIPVYKQGAEIPAGNKPALSSIGSDEGRGNSTSRGMAAKGFAVIGPEDSIEFVEPEGNVYEICNTQLKELEEAIYAVIAQIAATANKQTIDRSGLSKLVDNHEKELVLLAFANLIKDYATTLYTVISEGRNEDIVWAAMGMESFAILDRDSLIKEVAIAGQVAIPSKTWKKHYLNSLAHALSPDLNAQASLQIKTEIDEEIDKEPSPDELRQQEQQANTSSENGMNNEQNKMPGKSKANMSKVQIKKLV
jgi:hypothetical protein